MTQADIIIIADYVLTMDRDLRLITDGGIAVKNNTIVMVGSADEVSAHYESDTVIGGRGNVVFPGFANTHTHAAMVYFRGLADDLPLKVWLEDHIWPAEEKWLGSEFVGDAAELACLEMVKAGITLYNDMYFFGDAIARATKKAGMRAVVGAGILDFPSKTAGTSDEYFANAERFISDWAGDELIVPAVAPHAPYTCSPDTMVRARGLSEKYRVPMHLHLSETEWEINEVMSRYRKRPVTLLDSIGVLDEHVIAAHCVWVDDEEIDLLAARKVGVSHCIESNLKIASGIAPVIKMLKAGVKVTFGTDGAASNNDLDIRGEMSTAAKVHKASSGDPTALNAKEALLMATRWGAEALGLGSITGSLEEGKAADMVVADLNKPHLVPLYDIYSHIVYSMDSADIGTVIVNGKVLLREGKSTTADESEILEKARAWGKKIASANNP